jgi:hypothetical protein
MTYYNPPAWVTCDDRHVEFYAEFCDGVLVSAYTDGEQVPMPELVACAYGAGDQVYRFSGWLRTNRGLRPDLFGAADVPMFVNAEGWARTLLARDRKART